MSSVVTLSELADVGGVVGGPFGSNLISADYVDSGIPVIRGENLGRDRFVSGEFVYVTAEKMARDLRRNTAKSGDVIFTQRGTLGQVALVPDAEWGEYVVSQSQMRLRVNPCLADSRFVYYACSTRSFLAQVRDRAIATGVPHINLTILRELEIPRFSLVTQRAIANVLSVLDERISANSRKCGLAEELAESVFNQMVAGLPLVKAGTRLSPVLGGTPARDRLEYWQGVTPWISAKDVTAAPHGVIMSTSEMISEEASCKTRAKTIPAGATVVTARGTVGAVARLGVAASFNQSCYGFIPGDIPASTLFFLVKSLVAEAQEAAHGSVFDTITMRTFDHVHIPDLDEERIAALELRLRPLMELTEHAVSESRTLAALRDTLLPALMSGRLSVRQAEDMVSEVV